jgi:hypothetical protein
MSLEWAGRVAIECCILGEFTLKSNDGRRRRPQAVWGADMTQYGRATVVIGITGKRDLKGKDDAVRAALRAALETLDTRFPHTPKILLSALAEGADTIAAEEALARPDWQVVAPLPLRLDLYLQDFGPPAAERLRTLLRDPRVRMIELDPLIDASGKPFEPAALARQPNGSNESRSLHYEQVGLFIVQNCALLLAVMEADERPGRIGGTARIVDYRLHDQPDQDAREVLARSTVLRKPIHLDQTNTGPVWLIDPATASTKPSDLSARIKPLTHDPEPSDTVSPLLGEREPSEGPTSPDLALERSLSLLRHVDAFNQHLPAKPPEPPVKPGAPDALMLLRGLRGTLSGFQMRVNRKVRNSILGLAALFVLAIFGLEIYSAFNRQPVMQWTIYAYGAFLVGAFTLYSFARRFAWQPIAEDYRAVAESLRVQIVWWEAGLTGPEHRVDRFYLRGTRGSLALLRASLRHMVDASGLWPCEPKPASNPEQPWITGQINFFEKRIVDRRKSLSNVEAWTWFLIMTAMGPIAILPIVDSSLGEDLRWMVQDAGLQIRLPVFAIAAITVLAAGCWAVPRWARQMARHGDQHGRMFNFRRLAVALAAGLSLGIIILLAWGVWAPNKAPGNETLFALRELLVISSVVLTAIAGAIRFIADKLSWEAEVNGYEEILETFRRAKAELEALPAEPGTPVGDTMRGRIILELGKEALDENETWLRAHRERPLEPLVGG